MKNDFSVVIVQNQRRQDFCTALGGVRLEGQVALKKSSDVDENWQKLEQSHQTIGKMLSENNGHETVRSLQVVLWST